MSCLLSSSMNISAENASLAATAALYRFELNYVNRAHAGQQSAIQ